jgi:hypothetical protein
MKLERYLYLVLLGGLVLAAAACQKDAPTDPTPTVKANMAYQNAFGQPPVPAKGQCFARVGYYPLRAAPEQLGAVPFFLFDAQSELPLLLERLVNNPAPFPAEGTLQNPFPAGSTLQVGPRATTLDLALSVPQSPATELLAPMAAALTETAGQYPEIERVRIRLNGAPWPGMPAEGFVPEPERIVAPGPPLLLLVVGSWESDAAYPREILADFDRPVSIDSFTLQDQDGQQIKGDYFTSVFDMAVVLHPQDPTVLHEGMTLHASWRVTDRLGRSGEGEGRFELQRHDDHAEAR